MPEFIFYGKTRDLTREQKLAHIINSLYGVTIPQAPVEPEDFYLDESQPRVTGLDVRD